MESYSFGPPPPPLPTSLEVEKNPRRKLYIGLAITAGVIVLGMLVAVAVVGVKMVAGAFQEPSRALTLYTDALIQKNYREAYSLTSPGFRAGTAYPALLAYHGKLTDRLGALKSVKQTYWHIQTKDGITRSTIQAALQFERGSEIFEFVLNRENGTWRVFNYEPVTTARVGDN